MPTGTTEWSGAMATTDAARSPEYEWAVISGANKGAPTVGGPHMAGLMTHDVDRGRSRVVADIGSSEPWTGVGAGTPEGRVMDDWRDLLNFKGSPMPWLLLLVLAALGLVSLSISGRAGPLRAGLSAGS